MPQSSLRCLATLALAAACAIAACASEPMIVAHRGHWHAAAGAQNSLEAMHKADSVGVYGSEFDVWMLADGAMMVNHDRTFKGVNMVEATYPEARAVILSNGEPMPTLDEYLQAFVDHPGTRLVLELKSLPDLAREDQAAAKVVQALRYYGLADRTDVIAFSINACLAFRKLEPSLPVYYLDGDLSPKKIKELGLAGIDYHGSVLRAHPEWVEQAHELGLKVNVWTIDDPAAKEEFKLMGVDFITTNTPE